ncbi:GntR family transcriptional regulator [Pseudonocardia acaciae]|uniref:GntR family transcriptional regulator n=1 Tax=Pseudonocardia acaciae TaxID=551276 RepID=UPI00049123F0|nr:GntR family transcriptional regulator [Pseudonocardia acaciae]
MDGGVYPRLRDDVVFGDLAPGTVLVESTLAARYGTSRTPVREALRRLEQDGLVERAHRGLRVRAPGAEEILEVYEVRVALEGLAADAAARRRTEADLTAIRAAERRVRDAGGTDPRVMVAANRDFHRVVWAAGHNTTLVEVLERVHLHLLRYQHTTLSVPGRWESSLDEHAELVEAIAARDPARARTIGELHMTRAREIRLEMYLTGNF